ncbi:MAG: hypothetical protein GX862_09985 [Leucobacter sp.]|jgi:hypothetical protein|nr:hypothetical protein [Leucobacter sp.]
MRLSRTLGALLLGSTLLFSVTACQMTSADPPPTAGQNQGGNVTNLDAAWNELDAMLDIFTSATGAAWQVDTPPTTVACDIRADAVQVKSMLSAELSASVQETIDALQHAFEAEGLAVAEQWHSGSADDANFMIELNAKGADGLSISVSAGKIGGVDIWSQSRCVDGDIDLAWRPTIESPRTAHG